MSSIPTTSSTDELRQHITDIMIAVTGKKYLTKVSRQGIEATMSLIRQDREAREAKAEGIGAYLAISKISQHVGYLLAHRADGQYGEMTGEVIGNLWEAMKKIQDENVQHMRSSPPDSKAKA